MKHEGSKSSLQCHVGMQACTRKSRHLCARCEGCTSTQCDLSFEWQVNDMECFLTNNNEFGILTADTTYNTTLVTFMLHLLTYKHLMLQDTKSKKSPLMLSPILVHQSTNLFAYNYFASPLTGQYFIMCSLLEEMETKHLSIYPQFSTCCAVTMFHTFSEEHLRKLKSLRFSSIVAQEFLQIGNTYQEGFVDSFLMIITLTDVYVKSKVFGMLVNQPFLPENIHHPFIILFPSISQRL